MGKFFCLKCKKETDSTDSEIVTTKNNRKIMKAICAVCKSIKCKFVKCDVKGGDIVDVIGKTIGEVHFPGSNYLGPGTNFKERINKRDKPTDRVDELAAHHDLTYHFYKGKEKRHEADRKLLQELNSIQDPTFKEKLKIMATKAVIKPKLYLGLGLPEENNK